MTRIFICLFILVSLCPAAWAKSSFAKGVRHYNHGDFLSAEKVLKTAVDEHPQAWKPRYYYANTLLALARFDSAIYHYELCRQKAKCSKIAGYCDDGIRRAKSYQDRMFYDRADKGYRQWQEEAKKEQQLENTRQEIFRRAEDEIARVKREMHEQIDAEFERYDCSIYFYEYIEPEIREEAELEIRRIRENAERTANSYR